MPYIPPNCKPLDEHTEIPQIRLGIQGYPGTGKTWSALTFPNPIVGNFDRGLGAHCHRHDVIEVPFYDSAFCKTVIKSATPADTKDVLIKWMETEGQKIGVDQTFVMDGGTGLQNAYHRWFNANQSSFVTAKGSVNEFAEWNVKKQFFGEVMELLKSFKSHVVYLCHEVDQKDKTLPGQPVSYSGKIRPLLTGAFGDELGGHFTDWFRAHSSELIASPDEKLLSNFKMTLKEFQDWQKQSTNGCIYYWQTTSDSIFDAKCSTLVNQPKFIPATYESFLKWRRNIKAAQS